ncbi:MAG: radical SAM protein [Euryarchaeota archaeon]|nr:radical SAM protein [Euryarchaeota archaeon]
MKTVIVDGYVDEPACFGVPPYISPYIRYIAGALSECGIDQEDIHYFTIDQLRTSETPGTSIIKNAALVIVLAGMTVPGKYLRVSPITSEEISYICKVSSGLTVIGGPIRLGFSHQGGVSAKDMGFTSEDVIVAKGDIEAFVHDIIGDRSLRDPEAVEHRLRSVEEISRWAIKGSFIIRQHPDHPHLMCELETYRGCGRRIHCSFCTEAFYGPSIYRDIADVVGEVAELYRNGARYFRIGRQPDLFSYHAKDRGGDLSVPEPSAILSLYRGIRNVAPDLRVLHMDNANPATIAAFPQECREIMKTIIQYHTSGDVAALGMESADPAVIRANDLKAMPEDVFEVIRLMNEMGGARGSTGLPELLPGLNFVHGLPGETKKTFGMNYGFLKNVLDSDLLLRRINIRQVMAFPGTKVYGHDDLVKKHKKQFLKYKETIRRDIDLPMLRKVAPRGTVLTDVMWEVHDERSQHDLTFGRQFGSYPLLVGVSEKLPLGEFADVLVTDHGYRSVTAIPYPLELNRASLSLIKALPEVGGALATQIFKGIPYEDQDDLLQRVPESDQLVQYIEL